MKHLMVAVGSIVVLGGALFGSLAAVAAPPNRVSVTLSCDKDVTAEAALTFLSDNEVDPTLGGVSDLHCGAGASHVRVVVGLPEAPIAISVTQFDVVSSDTATSGSASCAGDTAALPARVECPLERRGARLVVR